MRVLDLGRVVGMSAYELAVSKGYEGTLESWLESLRYDHSDEYKQFTETIEAAKQDILSGKEEINSGKEEIKLSMTQIRDLVEKSLTDIGNAKKAATEAVKAEETEAVSNINSAKSGALSNIGDAETRTMESLANTLDSAIRSINGKGTRWEKQIEDMGTLAKSEYNQNADAKQKAFDSNAQEKQSAFDQNAVKKQNAYDQNVSEKTSAFDAHVAETQTTLDQHIKEKQDAFDSNAIEKRTAFDQNAEQKIQEYDTHTEQIQADIGQLKEDLTSVLDVEHTINLYDKNSISYAYGIGSTNLDVQSNNKNLAVIMDVEPNSTYTISGIRFGWNICYEFAIQKSEIVIGSTAISKLFEGLSYIDAERGYKTFTTSETAKSILLIYWRNGVDTVSEEEKRDKLQIEKNTTYTEYVPYGIYSQKLEQLDLSVKLVEKNAKRSINYKYVKNIPLFTRCSNGFFKEHPDWVSRQYELTALCVRGRYLYTGSHLGFKLWDIGIESEPVDITGQLTDNKYLTKNQYIEQWSINPWGVGGGERIPYKMEYYDGYIFAIVRGGSGFVDDSAIERNPNINVKNESETDGTTGYFIVMDDKLNVLHKKVYYGASKTEIGYRKPSGFVIDKEAGRIYISCQLYGWICYDISDPANPMLLHEYSPLDESIVSSINGAVLSSTCGPIEYQNGCVFSKDNHKYYAVAGYADGIHVWDVSDISNPEEIKNDIVSGDYGIFWQFRVKESAWNTTAHLFDVEVIDNLMYATIAPTTDHGNDKDRISGLLVLDISNLSAPTYKFYPIDAADWNFYQKIGDVKPSHLLITNNKVLLNNGNKGIAVYDITGEEPVYIGCIPSDGDEIYQMVKADDGRLISGCHIAPYNFRINRGVY